MQTRFILLFCVSLASQLAIAQNGFRVVFPGTSGPALLDSLFQQFKPDTVLPYGEARDTLYAKVLAKDDDSVRCIYSGHTLYLDPKQDPTQYIYLNGSTLGMNAEHAYPQSKGAATGFARSDMHHLYPTRTPVNEARGSLPYAEIPDNQTQRWYRKTQILTSKPSTQIEQYSEWTTTAFEPRETAKGDVARSIFYMYTMYRAQMNAADPNFFELQRPTLCQWNAQDPADSAELVKTWRIAQYQDGKPNPFVLDCTLAQRSWCPSVASNCTVNTQEAGHDQIALSMRILPQPIGDEGRLEAVLPFGGTVLIKIISTTGQMMDQAKLEQAQPGAFSWRLDTALLSGKHQMVFVEMELRGAQGLLRQVLPVLLSAR